MIPTKATIPDLRAALSSGKLTPLDVVEAHLERIRTLDRGIRGFVRVCEQGARNAAKADVHGPLRGLPFGIKDVLETGDMPTEHGSAIFEGARPRFDAAVVATLRGAGAIAIGKTATAEFAGTAPPATTHPLDPARTPGGSSSGSAAAVAAGMAVFALGTQTGGSVLRPAAFCGIAGFKPSYGLWPIAGMLPAAHSFDTIGVVARSAGDAAIIHATMMRMPEIGLPDTLPHVALCRTHLWDTLSSQGASAIEAAFKLIEQAGARTSQASLPEEFSRLTEHRAIINAFERSGNMMGLAARKDKFRKESRSVYQRGLEISGEEYVASRRALEVARASLDDVFGLAEILLAPVVPDVAPMGLNSTGDPRLQEIWSMLHCPTVTIPIGEGLGGLPLGLQLVARPFEDDLLLATARQVEAFYPEAARHLR
ncbi:MAG: putative amidase [Rhodobacteraceae bacterium HLUCCA12]|nr:MAG: putative amidase [Rhodobacteraceae bacterium HLUCCA12]